MQLRQLFDYARAYGYEDWLVLDASVVRGLAYYTGVVFEAFDRAGAYRMYRALGGAVVAYEDASGSTHICNETHPPKPKPEPGELRAICGGGRYDKLLETFGGEALPAVGFGFGDAVIMELLEAKNLKPALPTGASFFVSRWTLPCVWGGDR